MRESIIQFCQSGIFIKKIIYFIDALLWIANRVYVRREVAYIGRINLVDKWASVSSEVRILRD